MRSVIAVVLSMPDFLYFYGVSDSKNQIIRDFELASRLALLLALCQGTVGGSSESLGAICSRPMAPAPWP